VRVATGGADDTLAKVLFRYGGIDATDGSNSRDRDTRALPALL